MSKLSESIKDVLTEAKVTQTPGNDGLPAEGPTPGSSNAPKAKGAPAGPPPVATDPEVKNKDAEKVSKSTKKAAEPQDAKKTGDSSNPKQGSSDAVKEDADVEELDLEVVSEEEEELEIPATKAGMAKALFDVLREMDKDDLEDRFGSILSAIVEDEQEEVIEVDEESSELVREARARISAEDIDVSDDVAALVSDDDTLSEEFKTKAQTIFEAAVVAKVNTEIDRLEQEFATEITEAREQYEAQLSDKVDSYLSYVVEEWMKENELAIEAGIRTEITEDFLGGLKNLFTEHYIEIPDEKVEVVDTLAGRVEELEAALNESIEKTIELQGEADGRKQDQIFYELADGLADTEIEKLASLSEGVEFEDVDQYTEAISTLKESYFPQAPKVVVEEDTDEVLNETLTEDHSAMAQYTKVLGRTVRR